MDADLLAANREAIATSGMLNAEAQVYENQPVSDGMSGSREQWVPISPERVYPCRLMERSPQGERQSADRTVVSSGWRIVLPWDADVTISHRLSVNGNLYRVVGTDVDKADRNTLSAYCEVVS